MHSTNKAFEKYFQIELDDVRGIYQKTRNEKVLKKDSKRKLKAIY